jgi:hypothetical protein
MLVLPDIVPTNEILAGQYDGDNCSCTDINTDSKKFNQQAGGPYSQHFSHSFSLLFQGTSGGQVHKINTGNKHDENGNTGKQIHIEQILGAWLIAAKCGRHLSFFQRRSYIPCRHYYAFSKAAPCAFRD